MAARLFDRGRVRHELRQRALEVVAVTDPAPDVRRITFTGEDLRDAESPGPDDHVKLFFPAPDGGTIARDFTPRRLRPEVAELEVDFVLHADPGPASSWATTATVSSRLDMGGPRGSRLLPEGAEEVLLVADLSALPAVARWLELLEQQVRAHLVVSGPEATVREYLGPLYDEGRVALTACAESSEVAEAVSKSEVGASTYCWGAGESSMLVPVRRHWRQELGLSRAQVQVSAYWRAGVAGADHNTPIEPGDPD